MYKLHTRDIAYFALLALAACGGGGGGNSQPPPTPPPPRFTVGGTVSGLEGRSLGLALNGTVAVTVSANGGFVFPGTLAAGDAYTVTVSQMPIDPTQPCIVTQGTGSATANVSNIQVTCTGQVVGGTVTGLAGTGLKLSLNGEAIVRIDANGAFRFPSALATGDTYLVSVAAPPDNPVQGCTVDAGAGTVSANISVAVTCRASAARALVATGLGPTDLPGTPYSGMASLLPMKSNGVSTDATSRAILSHHLEVENSYWRSLATPVEINGNHYLYSFADISAGVDRFFVGLSGIRINPDSMTVTPISSAPLRLPGGGNPIVTSWRQMLAVHASKRLLYAASIHIPGLSAYAIDAQDGTLTLLTPSPLLTDSMYPLNLLLHPNGRIALVLLHQGGVRRSLQTYSIDVSTGGLTKLSEAPYFQLTGTSEALTLSSDGRHVHVGLGRTTTYGLDTRSGALSQISNEEVITPGSSAIRQPGGPTLIARDATSTIAYVEDSQTHLLRPTWTAPADVDGAHMVFDVTGKYLYVTDNVTDGFRILGYSVDDAGVLTPVPGGEYPLAGDDLRMIVDSSGQRLHVLSADYTTVHSFDIDRADGSLSGYRTAYITGSTTAIFSIAGPTLPNYHSRHAYVRGEAEIIPVGIDEAQRTLSLLPGSAVPAETGSESITMDPVQGFLYSAQPLAASISAFDRDDETGSLSPMSGSPFIAPASPREFAMEPLRRFGFATNPNASSITRFAVNATGELTAQSADYPTSVVPDRILIHPSLSYAYALSGSGDVVMTFGIRTSDGQLTEYFDSSGVAAPSQGSGPRDMAVDSSGKWMFVLNNTTANVATFTTGLARYVGDGGSVDTGSDPRSLAIDPTGRFMYVANQGSGSISAYRIDSTRGVLTQIAGSPFTVSGAPSVVAVTASGRMLLVGFSSTTSLAAYGLDDQTGSLTAQPSSSVQLPTAPSRIVVTRQLQ